MRDLQKKNPRPRISTNTETCTTEYLHRRIILFVHLHRDKMAKIHTCRSLKCSAPEVDAPRLFLIDTLSVFDDRDLVILVVRVFSNSLCSSLTLSRLGQLHIFTAKGCLPYTVPLRKNGQLYQLRQYKI